MPRIAAMGIAEAFCLRVKRIFILIRRICGFNSGNFIGAKI
jgi:hypothetical protein